MVESLEHASERLIAGLGLPACTWHFPPADTADDSGLVAIGGDLRAETLITAYCTGLFPMPLGSRTRLGWWSPDPRAILEPAALRLSRSLRRSRSRYVVTVDTAFESVMSSCADPRRPHGWITPAFQDAYTDLFTRGLAHSVETWTPEGDLVGGLYGVSVGALFAGESMFHHAVDASKVALAALVDILRTSTDALLDVQWLTPHLGSLGVVEISRAAYLDRLAAAISSSAPVFEVDGG